VLELSAVHDLADELVLAPQDRKTLPVGQHAGEGARLAKVPRDLIGGADYRHMFEQSFLPEITFVDVGGMFEDAEAARAVHAIDPHDAPTGQLAVLLSRTRPIVYAHDKSLWRPGLAPAPANFQAVLTAGFQADNSENLTQGFTYVAGGVVWAVDGAARGVAGVLKVPRWAP